MNEYRITYATDEGETEQTYITERTEAAARKFFKRVLQTKVKPQNEKILRG